MSPVCVARQLLRLTVKTDTHTYRQTITHSTHLHMLHNTLVASSSSSPGYPCAFAGNNTDIAKSSERGMACSAPREEEEMQLERGLRFETCLCFGHQRCRSTLHPAPCSPLPPPCSLLVLAAPCLPMESTASRGSCFEFDDAVCGLSKVCPDPPSSTDTRFLLLP